MLFLEAFAKRVERTRAYVAIDDADCENGELCEPVVGRSGFGMIKDRAPSSRGR